MYKYQFLGTPYFRKHLGVVLRFLSFDQISKVTQKAVVDLDTLLAFIKHYWVKLEIVEYFCEGVRQKYSTISNLTQ